MGRRKMAAYELTARVVTNASTKELDEVAMAMEAQLEMLGEDFGREAEGAEVSEWVRMGGVPVLASGELAVVLEAARVALADGETFDMIAGKMDVSDEELCRIREKLRAALEDDNG